MGNPLERSRPALEVVGKPQDQAIVRARRVLTARHYSKRTAESYRHWIERFLIFHNWADPLDSGKCVSDRASGEQEDRGVNPEPDRRRLVQIGRWTHPVRRVGGHRNDDVPELMACHHVPLTRGQLASPLAISKL